MKLDLRITGVQPTTHVYQTMERFMGQCIEAMGLMDTDVGRIIIADESHYENAIKEIDKNALYTSNETYVGVGKTISKYCEDNQVVSDIIYLAGIIDRALSLGSKSDNILDLDDLEQQSVYIVYHELGHCKDAKIRQCLDTSTIVDTTKAFRINQVCKYYRNLLLDELAACVFSGPFMTARVFELELTNLFAAIVKNLEDIEVFKLEYSKNSSKLYEMAFFAAGAFWFILIQYSKIMGAQIGNSYVSDLTVKLWQGAGSEIRQILSRYSVLISQIWQSYPHYDSKVIKELDEIWRKLALSFGCKFEHTDQGDMLLWH